MDYKFGYKFASKEVEKFLTAEFKDNADPFDSWEPQHVQWRTVESRKEEEKSSGDICHYYVGAAPDYNAAYKEILKHIESVGVDVQSLLWLARLYVMGDGVEQDLGSACALLCRAAALGNKEAVEDLETGFHGRIIRTHGIWNEERYSILFSEFARRKFKWAQYAMAMAYADGKIVPQDYRRSVLLCFAAAMPSDANDGYWAAQMHIGDLLLTGEYGYRSVCEALYWYAKISDPAFWAFAIDRALIRAKLVRVTIDIDDWFLKNSRLFYRKNASGGYKLENCLSFGTVEHYTWKDRKGGMPMGSHGSGIGLQYFYFPSHNLDMARVRRIFGKVYEDVVGVASDANQWPDVPYPKYLDPDGQRKMSFSSCGLKYPGTTSVHDQSDWFGLLTRDIRGKGYESLCLSGPRNESFKKRKETWEFASQGRRDFVLDFLRRIQQAAYSVCEKSDIAKSQKVSSLLKYSITRESQGFDWAELLSDDPSLIDCCDIERLDVDNLEKILLMHPLIINECDRQTKKALGGMRWARLAASCDAFLSAGEEWMNWGALVAANPGRLDIAMDHLTKDDWVTIIKAHPELSEKCPATVLGEVKQAIKAEAAEKKQAVKNAVKRASSSATNGKVIGLLKKYWMPTLSVLMILSAFDEGGAASFFIGAGLGAFWWWKKRKG